MSKKYNINNNIGAIYCLLLISYLILTHIDFWFFKELSDGGHVSNDFYEAGVTLHIPERIAGFFTAGIPLVFFSILLIKLSFLFRILSKGAVDAQQIVKQLVSSAIYAIIGSVSMMLYPTLLSFLFIAMNSMEQNVIIASIEPLVFMLLLISLLFFLIARSLKTTFQYTNITNNG